MNQISIWTMPTHDPDVVPNKATAGGVCTCGRSEQRMHSPHSISPPSRSAWTPATPGLWSLMLIREEFPLLH
jgi:hypothetical protein